VTYDMVFVPRPAGASLEDALAAIDNGQPDAVPDAERDRWFGRLIPAAREVLADVAVDEEARTVEHPATGIRVEIRAGGVVIAVPYEGEVDPVTVMTLTHDLAREIERTTGLVGWDTSLGEPVSPRDVPPPRPAPRTEPDGDEEETAGGGGFVLPAAPPPTPERSRRRPWWRFWARG
jgi:hypothetical protein